MNQDDKLALLAKVNEYWAKEYPDAFVEMPDGTKVLHDDLIDYKQDQEIKAHTDAIEALLSTVHQVDRDVSRTVTSVARLSTAIQENAEQLGEITRSAATVEELSSLQDKILNELAKVHEKMANFKQLGDVPGPHIPKESNKNALRAITALVILWPIVLTTALILWGKYVV